tara:strand:- start:741 stop:944 length:204 start_codon:yes stop_codon:yes gene_type:complete
MNWIKRLFKKKEPKQCAISGVVRSGTYCKCNACKHEGYAYGILTSKGGTAGFCQRCGINNQLIILRD